MASSSFLAKTVFVLLAASAADSIIGLNIRNGFFALNDSLMAQRPLLLPQPGPPLPMRTRYTALAPLDAHLSGLLMFFWPAVTGELPALSLFAVYMAGQIVPAHALVMLEGLRGANRGRVTSFSTVWGMVYQSIPWGVVKPIYWAVNLWTAPTARVSSSTPTKEAQASLAIDSTQLLVLPVAITLGLIAPTVLAAVELPGVGSLGQQQGFLALWQGFPILVAVFQALLASVVRMISGTPLPSTPEAKAAMANNLRTVYLFCLTVAFVTHVGTLMFASMGLSAIFAPDSPPADLKSVLVPMSPLSGATVKSMAEGCLVLLQYDMYYACGSTLLWAGIMYARGTDSPRLAVLSKGLFLALIFGPGGAAMALIAARDERVLLSKTTSEPQPALKNTA
ncbi:hypothetical protein NKR23_g8629 [Pleurostoma richardsiae]|uniref:Uncharacterized protein n=1 Tax=Pleurostoma richardsiae TaxID=41990 RepID=A0AA38RSP8_9PEZI|nr:hypothetical protein NKR23_g8629 [Pleurostoma richardsiae]